MSESLKIYYYVIVFIAMLYALYKVGFNKTGFLIILTFWSGLFQYLGAVTNTTIHDVYKVGLFLVLFFFSWRKIVYVKTKHDLKVNVVFILFTISFWISYFINGGGLLTILSQYLYKYGFVFFLYHYFKDIEFDKNKGLYTAKTLLMVLKIQVVLSVIKLAFIGIRTNANDYEAIVGSMSAGGAGVAVVIPIMALIFYWVYRERKFSKKDWYLVISFVIIAFASAKRQPIVFYPLILFLLLSYVEKGFKLKKTLKYIPLVLILFVVGAKLNPSFNPESKVWGSFDVDYITRYVSKYYFGTAESDDVLAAELDTGIGRGAAIVIYFQPNKLTLNSINEILWGRGSYEVVTASKGRFSDTSKGRYGIEHSGLMGKAGAMLYSYGYIGALLMLLFAIIIIRKLRDKRMVAVIVFYYLWDFLFYLNQVVYSNQSAIILLFIVFYSNYLLSLKKNNSELQQRINT